MSDKEAFEPHPFEWVRKQVDQIESSGGAEGMALRGMPIVLLTLRGARTGKVRKIPVMRVEHDGRYAAVASLGGAPKNPVWYHNLTAHPRVTLQDGTMRHELVAREVTGTEKDEWWARAVAAYPDYADYQTRTERVIPVFVLEPAS
jgi:deazaflavin-dependent oxidoreductase (nitroreductase family)